MPERDPAAAVPGRWSTIAMAATACIAVEAALTPPGLGSPGMFAATAAALVALGLLAARLIERHRPTLGATAPGACAWVAAGATGALAVETLLRVACGSPPLLDVVFLGFLRDTVVALALLAHHPGVRRACGGLAAFLVLAASAEAADARFQGFVALFAGIGVWWLLAHHWQSLQGAITAGKRVSMPRRWAAGLPAAALVLPILLPASALSLRALDGFMPASGGQRTASLSARSGVGDGDALVKGLDDIRSFGPIEDAPFLNSHEPSLYDMFDDRYSEPETARTQRAVSLPFQQTPSGEESEMAQSRRAAREFSTVRRPGGQARQLPADLESPAVFHLKGRVPLHLRLETFARYDGVAWEPEPAPAEPPATAMEPVKGRPWLRIAVAPSGDDHHAPAETHAVKVVRIDGNRIPAPNQLTAIHIDHVDRADFFRWEQPGVVALDRESIPDQLVIHLQSRVVDRRRLARSLPFLPPGRDEYRQTGDDARSLEVRALAESWVEGVPRGIAQVERIVERLRSDYVLDDEARAAGADGHTVAEFLTVSRRGPDYLFASSAVFLLRSLGYGARLVGGFHASPDRYDARAGHTAVLPEDVHFWAEVAIGPHDWLTIEPSPGYAVLGPPRSLTERLVEGLVSLARAVARHPVAAALAAVLAALGVRFRAALADLLDTLLWRLRGGGESRAAVLATVALLDRRCRRAGLARPRHVTPPRWLAAVGERIPDARPREQAGAFLRLADEALYAPEFRPRPDAAGHRAAAGVWSLRTLAAIRAARAGAAPQPRSGDPR